MSFESGFVAAAWLVTPSETTLHCKTVRFSKCLKAGGDRRADRPAGFLYQWHKFPFHAVDWAIGSGSGIGLLLLVSLTILDFTRKHSLLSSVCQSVSLAKLQAYSASPSSQTAKRQTAILPRNTLLKRNLEIETWSETKNGIFL